ncbi:MAG: hypothetical protein C0432_02820 [Candidatus Puniceispirillum sp.]|nr:hypothetical protein [Candidatus Pelagibacter sp.]MBA4283209.1 hypothetical protein [Candidatus Puniceispirillum sp.]
MNFELAEKKDVFINAVSNFFNYWKRYALIIIASSCISLYGISLILNSNEKGSGLTVITISVAILGWLISLRNADENIRRIKRIEYLSTAYEGIALYLRRDSNAFDYNVYIDGLERSFTIIQLYGTRKEIKLVCSIIEQYNVSNDNVVQCDTLLNVLRDGLRKELLLPKALRYVRTMRLDRFEDKENRENNEKISFSLIQ